MYVLALDDYVAEMDPNSKQQLSVFVLVPVSPGNANLEVYGALNCIDDATELDQESITHCIRETAPMFVNAGAHDRI